jgi:hypothetical protein
MTPVEILSAEAERNGKRPGALLHGISVAIDERNAVLLHDAGSVVLLDPIDKSRKKYSVHLATVDSPMGVVRSVQKLRPKIFSTPGLEWIYGDTKDQQVIRMLRTAGYQVLKSDDPNYTWMAKE